MSLGLFACDYRVIRNPDWLVEHLPAEPSTLNPITQTDAYASSVNRYIYDSLVERDNATLEFIPKLAERWDISDDHLQYTFYLRRDAKWHDGVPVTAEDVVYTFQKINDPKVDAAPLRVYYKDIIKVEKLDDYAVRFTYKDPYYKAFEFCGGIQPIPKHVFDDGTDFNKHPAGRLPVGNGPFKFVQWDTGRKIELERNSDYWGRKPKIEGLMFKIIPDSTASFEVLKKGELDLSSMRAIQWVKQTEKEGFKEKFNKHRYFLPGYSFIAWNQRKPFFQDRRVRQAMTMLINREEILKTSLFGQGEIVASNFYIFGPVYDKALKPYPYDPEQAKKLLKEAGWEDHDGDGVLDKDGVPFKFDFMTGAGSSFATGLSSIMREDFKKVGIVVEVRQLEWTVFVKNLDEHAFDATTLAWSSNIEEDPYQIWHSSQVEKGSNFIGFADPRADELIEKARMEFDKQKRIAYYREFQKILYDEQPYTFLYTQPSLVAVDKRFTDVKVYPLGLDLTEWGIGPSRILYQ